MENSDPKKIDTVRIHNKLSNNFRELHVDGAYGGITPKGLFNINFYAERLPIPKSTEYEVSDKKLIPLEDSEDSKRGIIREFETGIYMTLKTAKELQKWLEDSISKYEELKNSKE